MKTTLLIAFFSAFMLIGVPSNVAAQSTVIGGPTTREYSSAICADNNGNTYVGGGQDSKALLVKQNAAHVTLWSKNISLPSSSAINFTVIDFVAVHGDTVFGCGAVKTSQWASGYGSFTSGFYFKMNAQTGALYWIKSIPNTGTRTSFSSMRYVNGKYLLTGGGFSTSTGYFGKVAAVSSQTGQLIWETPGIRVEVPDGHTNYFTSFISATEVVNGKMYITGTCEATGGSGSNLQYIFLVGIDENGMIFLKKYFQTNNPLVQFNHINAQTITIDNLNHLVISFNWWQYSTIHNGLGVLKCDLQGNVVFCRVYNTVGNDEIAQVIAMNATGNDYVLYGICMNYDHLFFLKISATGTYMDCKLIHKPNVFYTGNYMGRGYAGNSVFVNGLHYFVNSEEFVALPAFDSDINQFIVDGNLENPANCEISEEVQIFTTDQPLLLQDFNLVEKAHTYVIVDAAIVSDALIPAPCNDISLTLTQNMLCASAEITATTTGFTSPIFTWSNGADSSVIEVNSPAPLIVTIIDAKCCRMTDTIVPVFNPSNLVVNLPPDTTVCLEQGNAFTIVSSVSTPGVTYRWINGSTGTTLAVTASGTFWLEVTDGCATVRDSIQLVVKSIPVISPVAAMTVCADDFPATLSPYVTVGSSVVWNDGLTTAVRTVNGAGNYTITASNMCGSRSLTIPVTSLDLPQVFMQTQVDTCIQVGGSISLTPVFLHAQTSWWANSASSTITSSGVYKVYASNQCGVDSAVCQVTLRSVPSISALTNVAVCANDFPATLNPVISAGSTVVWNDGPVTAMRTVNGPGNYTVTASNVCGPKSLTIAVSSLDLPNVLMQSVLDTCIQVSDSFLLAAVYFNTQSSWWSNGAEDGVASSGIYTVYASNQCGIDSAVAHVTINHYPQLFLPDVLDTCFDIGTGFVYTAEGTGGNYQWGTAVPSPDIWISQEGTYVCTLTNGCGMTTDSMLVRRLSAIDIFMPSDSVRFCRKQIALSELQIETNYEMELFSEYGIVHGETLSNSGWYFIHAFNKCGSAWDSIYVNLQNEPLLFLPNAFTPNSDKMNETFRYEGENITISEVRIFNRWGETVYAEDGDFTGWDGRYKGEMCMDGMYAVKVHYLDCFGIPAEFNGHVNLLK